MVEKISLGLVEEVIVRSGAEEKKVLARIDTGAQISSIDAKLAAELRLGPIEAVKKIKSANGNKLRPALKVNIELAGRELKELFTIADRAHMKFPVLIGQNILMHNYIIDPGKKND